MGGHDTGGARASEALAHPAAGGGEGVQIDSGMDAESVQHPQQVFRGQVSGGAVGVGAVADAAGGAVELGDARGERGMHVGKGLPVGVVEVRGDPLRGDAHPLPRPGVPGRGRVCRYRWCPPTTGTVRSTGVLGGPSGASFETRPPCLVKSEQVHRQ